MTVKRGGRLTAEELGKYAVSSRGDVHTLLLHIEAITAENTQLRAAIQQAVEDLKTIKPRHEVANYLKMALEDHDE